MLMGCQCTVNGVDTVSSTNRTEGQWLTEKQQQIIFVISAIRSVSMQGGREIAPSMYKQLLPKEVKDVREKLARQQRQQCPLCGRLLKDPCLDHDHDTGAIRGVLCRNCNRVEGKIFFWVRTTGANPVEFLRRLARYWVKHSVNKHGLLHPSHGKPKKKRPRKRKCLNL